MKRTLLPLAIVVSLGAVGTAAHAESWLEDFENENVYPIDTLLRDTDPWWAPPGAKSPTIQDGVGVAASVGLSAAQRNFHWLGHPFEWKDPTVAGIVVQLDLRTPDIGDPNFPWRDDNVGWTIAEESESSNDFFQVSLARANPVPGGPATITGKWANATTGTGRSPVIVTYPGSLITGFSWYRLRAQFTKLTVTSAKIDVTLTAMNADGTLGDQIVSASIEDTSAFAEPKDVPHPNHFTAATMWPTYKSYNESAAAPADNAYFEIIRVVPACASKVMPDEFTIQSAEADINQPSTPSSFDYVVENAGQGSFNYTVTELDEQQLPADVPWLSTNKSNGTVAPMGTDTVTASINTAGLTHGIYAAYLKFTDDCDPSVSHLRRIDLTVYGCRWDSACGQERSYSTAYPNFLPEDVVYRITNLGDSSSNYTVGKTGGSSCFDWLVIDNPTGAVGPGEYVDVVARIDVAALAGSTSDSSFDCTLTLGDDCSPQAQTRNVRLRYFDQADTQVFVYKGDVDPQQDNSGGPGIRFAPDPDSVANGAVEEDFGAVNSRVWHMVDAAGDFKSWYRAQYWTGEAWDNISHHGEGGSTIVARLKVNSWSADRRRAFLGLGENDSSSAEFHWGGADGFAAESKRVIEEQTGLGTSDFVILWMSAKGAQPEAEWQCDREINLYLVDFDSNILWHKQIASASAEGSTRTGFFFGDSYGAGEMDVVYDWISGTNAGAFAPGEEVPVLGRSLIMSDSGCLIPFPDTDGDTDVDMTDFAVVQRCFSPMMGVTEECSCLDRDHSGFVDGNDLQEFIACATGPGVVFDKTNPPENCHP